MLLDQCPEALAVVADAQVRELMDEVMAEEPEEEEKDL